MNILLLEDTKVLNKAITQLLTMDNHTVLSFTDGQDALENINYSIDLYILDITVPNVNGLELLEYILNFNSTSKVIIMSADISIDTISKAYELGSIDFIKKPFEIKELQLKILAMHNRHDKLLHSINYIESLSSLTHKEKSLLKLLVENKNEIVTLEDIDNAVYTEDTMSTDALRSLMKRLRSKLADDIIKTMPYQGYMLVDI